LTIKLKQAFKAWADALGSDAVATDTEAIKAAQTATFATRQRVQAIIRPADRVQVQRCVQIANQFNVALYTVSKGKNWGLGSRVPTDDNCVLMELGRLNRIVDYDEKMAYLTVEPGVTFRQASEYLRSRGSSLFLAVIGGPPESSLVGNALERGDGIGPYGERIANACAMEVVLPNGECIHTGFERFPDAKVSKISRWGVGPSLDGLFSQSNLGVVTQMTFWLMALPQCFQSFMLTIGNNHRLQGVIETLRQLQAQGVIRANSVALWNGYKMIASERQYPWEQAVDQSHLSLDRLKKLKSPWGKSEWIGVGGLYAPSHQHARADRRLIKKALKGQVQRLVFLNRTKSKLLRKVQRPLKWATGIDVGEMVRTLYDESVFLGFTTARSTKSTYWRKKVAIPNNMDPDRDLCGVVWLCPVIPYDGKHVIQAIDIITKVANEHFFEPHIAFIFPSERAVYMFPSIVYDREVAHEDARAMACHDKMFDAMIANGYFPYRLGIQSMNSLPAANNGYDRLVARIKQLLDPGNILSPGRYKFDGNR
jgi:4-cresol dehydrogenase (hydroxylating)